MANHVELTLSVVVVALVGVVGYSAYGSIVNPSAQEVATQSIQNVTFAASSVMLSTYDTLVTSGPLWADAMGYTLSQVKMPNGVSMSVVGTNMYYRIVKTCFYASVPNMYVTPEVVRC